LENKEKTETRNNNLRPEKYWLKKKKMILLKARRKPWISGIFCCACDKDHRDQSVQRK